MERLLEIWPTISDIADAIDAPYPTVAAWNHRGIPPKRYPALILAAKAVGHTLSYEELAAMPVADLKDGAA